MDIFTTPVNIEVQYASEAVIAAIERAGGVITTRYYDLLSVMAKSNPYRFFELGLPIPRGKKPPRVNLLLCHGDICYASVISTSALAYVSVTSFTKNKHFQYDRSEPS